MTAIDIDSLLSEISPELPAGENLEYDPAFGELTRAAEGKPDQNLGDASLAGEPPDWKAVRKGSIELLAKAKDLRIAVLLARALTNVDGIRGLSDGLALVKGMLETHWDNLHPQLDPDDQNDPTERVNIITTLCDRGATLNSVAIAPLVSAKGLGRFGLRDIQVARGDVPPPADDDAQIPDMGSVSAAFMDCPINELKATSEALNSAQESLKSIDVFLTEQIGSAQAPNLGELTKTLNEAAAIVHENLAKRGESVEMTGEDESMASNPGSVSPASQPVSGVIASREDAARMMDKISEYFRNNEPSSPVPLLMQRAKRLSSLGFMEILKDIAPDGLQQAQNIGGIGDSSDN